MTETAASERDDASAHRNGGDRDLTDRAMSARARALHIADAQPSFWQRLREGHWEPGLLRFLAARLGPSTTLLDLGAWVGPVSLLAAACGARVIAVEADPVALDQFEANRAANPELAARIAVLPVAIAPRAGVIAMGARRKAGDSMSSLLLADAPGAWPVRAVTPADLSVLCTQAPDLVIKLDIEGGEYDLLPAMAPLLAARPGGPEPDLVVSFHRRELIAARGERAAIDATQAALASLDGWCGTAVRDDWSRSVTGALPARDIAARLAQDPACPDTWLMQPAGAGA